MYYFLEWLQRSQLHNNSYLINGDAAAVELEEEVTKQIANSSKNEKVKLSFQEITTCFDLLDALADDLAACSTQEAQDCLNTASKLRKRKCDLLINVRKYEKVLTNDGSVSTRSNSPLKMHGTSATASVPVSSSNTTENLANNFISTTAADFSTYTSTYGLSTFDLDAHQRYSFPPLPGTNGAMIRQSTVSSLFLQLISDQSHRLQTRVLSAFELLYDTTSRLHQFPMKVPFGSTTQDTKPRCQLAKTDIVF